MRLKNIYYLCKQAFQIIDGAKAELETIENSNKEKINIYKCKDWDIISSTLYGLANIDCLSDYINIIKEVEPNNVKDNVLILRSPQSTTYNKAIITLKDRICTLIDLCESMGYSPNENGFDVKLPENMDLSDFSECIKDINMAFNQNPYLNQEDDKIEFKALDVGSKWLIFAAICTGATKLLEKLAVIVDKVVMIRSHILTCKYQEQQLKDMGAKSDLVDSMIQVHKQTTSLLYENVVRDIEDKLGKLNDGDQRERLKHSLDLLSDWMAKGMEIYSSIDAPDEIKALFPPVEKQKLSKIDIKRLTEKSESENNE